MELTSNSSSSGGGGGGSGGPSSSAPVEMKRTSQSNDETDSIPIPDSPNNFWGTPRRHTWASKGILHSAALDPFHRVELTLIRRKEISADVVLFSFQLPNPTDQIGCLPGQFVEATVVHNGTNHSRFYSPISVFSEYGTLDIMMKMGFTGAMVDHFSRLEVGDKVFFRGPVGGFHYIPNTYDHIVLLASGVGVAPMVQITKAILHDKMDNTKATVFCRYENDVTPFKDFFEQTTSTDPRFRFKCITCNSSSSLPDDSEFSNFIPPPSPTIKIVLCGAPKHVLAWEISLKERGYTAEMLYNFFKATVSKGSMPPLGPPTTTPPAPDTTTTTTAATTQ